MKTPQFLLFIAAVLLVSLCQADATRTPQQNFPDILLENLTGAIKAPEKIVYLEDKDKRFSKEQVLSTPFSHWSPIPNAAGNFSFSNSAYWYRFSLRNTQTIPLELYIHVDYALLDHIHFYQIENGQFIQTKEAGDTLPFHQREVDFPTFLFPVSLKAQSESEILLRIESKGTVQAPVSIWSKEQFLIDSQSFLFLYGCFLSAMLIMSAYNFLLFLTIRDKQYFLYSLFILLATGVHASLDGFAYQWFWPEAPQWHQISAIFFIATGCFTTTLFTQALLPIPSKGLIRISIMILMSLTASSAVMTLFLSYHLAAILNGLVTVITMSGVVVVCLAMLKHSPTVARYFILAWGTYFAGIILKSSSNIGFIDSNFLSEYGGNIGAISGILIMSLALAEKINQERRAKETAQTESISHLRRFQRLYENALEGVFTFDTKGNLLNANPAFVKLMNINTLTDFNLQHSSESSFYFPESSFEHLLKALESSGSVTNYETQMINRDGISNWVTISARRVMDKPSGTVVIEGTVININERKAFEEQLKHLASHDSLTGLVNRRAFETSAEAVLDAVKAHQEKACVLYLDLDRFKIVNDLCGHSAGDVLLKNLSQRLYKELSQFNSKLIIARLGGDEFGILLPQTSLKEAQKIAEQIRRSIENFLFVWEGNRFSLGVSIGLVELYPYHQAIDQVLVMADTACYLAKDQGRNRVHTFVESDQDLQIRQLEMHWVTDIKAALAEDRFFLVFQTICPNLQEDTHYHYEILLRLVNQNGNLCAPGQFLPAAERYNLMPNIDRWVITHYFAWLQAHPEHLEHLSCASINLSTQSIGNDSFSVFLKEAFEHYAIPPEKICFEITESMAITHVENTHDFIDTFHQLGCRFALDDFGTGFSSYAYLKELNVDFLKIDGMFIKHLVEDEVSRAMVKSISDVAGAIGIETIAEFVESSEIQSILKDIGITYSQGYHLHKPSKLESSNFLQFLDTHANKSE